MPDKNVPLPFSEFMPGLNIWLDLDLPDDKKEKALSVRISKDLYRALEMESEAMEIPISDLVRHVLWTFYAPLVTLGLLEEAGGLYRVKQGFSIGAEKAFGQKYDQMDQTQDYLNGIANYFNALKLAHEMYLKAADTLEKRGELIAEASNKMREFFGSVSDTEGGEAQEPEKT